MSEQNQRAQPLGAMAAAGPGASQLAGQIYRPARDDSAAADHSADFRRATRYAQNIATATISLVLLAALYAFRAVRIYFIVALMLLIPSIGCRVALQFTPTPAVELLAAISSCLFLAVTVVALVSQAVHRKERHPRHYQRRDLRLPADGSCVCVRLRGSRTANPGSFSTALFHRPAGNVAPLIASLHSFIYYSFVCLTTTGFGDIAPISEGARSLSVMESVFGQLYVAILIARLVSLEVAQSMMKER